MTAMKKDNDFDAIENAEKIIERFGGIRPMANKMHVPVTTVQGWKKRNVIPGNRYEEVVAAAESNNIDLSGVLGSVANENVSSVEKTEQSFEKEMSAASGNNSPAKEAKHEAAVLAAEKRVSEEPRKKGSGSGGGSDSDIMKAIDASHSRAVRKSVTLTLVFLALTVVAGWAILGGESATGPVDDKRLIMVEDRLDKIEEKQSFFSKIVPENLQDRLDEIMFRTENIQDVVGTISKHAEGLAVSVVEMDTQGITRRLENLESQMQGMGAPTELSSLLGKVAELQKSVEGQTQLSASIEELNKMVGGMQGRMDNLDEELATAQQENDALGSTLEGVSQQELKAAAMLLGLAQFRSSLNRNEGFEQDLGLMQKMVGSDDPELEAAINKLAPHAKQGVLTPEGLGNEFKSLAGDIVVASLQGEDVSVKEKARARLNEILQVKKDGELITGTDTQATIVRAQNLLDQGDIHGAITELQSLEGEAATTAQPFIQNAEMTLLAQKVQHMLTGKVLGDIQSTGVHGGGNIESLIHQLEGLSPSRGMHMNKDLGISVLPRKQKLPDLSLER